MAPRVVCVVGPTACGKTALGVLLAKRYNGEVVSADSMQIYRGMTIGTAAPTAEEMDGVPHHMVAVADPAEPWSAARYVREAAPAVDGILARGKLPILVGGTGLWLEALIQGREFAAGHAGTAVRRELQDRLEREGIEPLLRELYSKLLGTGLRPRTVVCYDREAFTYAPGNVRVTLDRNIRTGLNCLDFLRPERFPLKPLEGLTVLEVKYDDFLPELVRMAVQTPGRRAGACSKYALCRRFD